MAKNMASRRATHIPLICPLTPCCPIWMFPLPQHQRLMAKRGRPLIRAILFIVRLRRDVQAQHRRRTTRKRMGGLAQTAGMLRQRQQPLAGDNKDRPRLTRCESSRRPQRELQRQQQHRNSAPSAVFLRTPTPQPYPDPTELAVADIVEGGEFESFLRMPQPYQLMEANGCLKPSPAHQLAARALFRRRVTGLGGSLDNAQESRNGGSKTSGEFASRLVPRQGSVETAAGRSASKCPPDGPRRKLKAGMVGLLGALTALEQGDLEALGAVLARNGQQEQFRLDEPLEGGMYAAFEPRLHLLDVALTLGRRRAAEMLMEAGAQDGQEVPSVDARRAAVEAVLARCERKARELPVERNKEEEKRARQLDAQLVLLRRMRAQMAGPSQLPPAPSCVRAECVSFSAVAIHFEHHPLEASPSSFGAAAVVRAKVEWSTCPEFSTLAGAKEVGDLRTGRVLVEELPLGGTLAFRVSIASIWGWGPPARASPPLLRVSSWTELEEASEQHTGRLDPRELAELVEQVERHRQGPVWQRIFPSCSPVEHDRQKRKTGLKHLFSASSKFVRNVQRGLYLVTVFYTEGRILCTVDDCLPVICVDENSTGLPAEEMHWLMKLSLCWEQLQQLQESLGACAGGSANWQLRARLLDAALAMHNALGVRDIGRLHHVPVQPHSGTALLLTVRLVPEQCSSEAQGLAMRWMRLEKLLRRKQGCAALECLNRELLPLLNFFESSLIPLQPGLYLSYLRLQSSLNSIHVLVPENLTSALPFAQIRQNGHVTCEEWAHLEALARLEEGAECSEMETKPSEQQRQFHEQLARAARKLVLDLELDAEQLLGTRLFRHRLVQLDAQVSLILVMPRPEEVCQVCQPPGPLSSRASDSSSLCGLMGLGGSMLAQFRGCLSVPVPVFQMINLCAYQPDFLSAYCALSVFLEHFLTVAQYEQRACLAETEARVYVEQLDQLTHFQQRLEAIWRSARWISNFASVARDRGCAHRFCSLPLTRLLRPADEPTELLGRDRLTSVLGSKRNGLLPPPLSPLGALALAASAQSQSCASSPAFNAKKFLDAHWVAANGNGGANSLPSTPSQPRLNAAAADENGHGQVSSTAGNGQQCAVLRVFVAFDTGPPWQKGPMSVRLRVFGDTTAAEVVQLVVRQIAKLHSPSPTPDPRQHCLVSVLGARERRFTDDFAVLRMGQPWDRGRLCVRHVRQIGAAIELANESAV